ERTLLVMNDGQTPLDATRIFDRFYRATKREGSTGLGLPLVKAIAESYHLEVQYEYRLGQHCFRVTWPN
ncbi:MAG: sensor histidine kinase, partial [Alistipes sp.]|nr:sensor histidine kinase [Alistipes sp.]